MLAKKGGGSVGVSGRGKSVVEKPPVFKGRGFIRGKIRILGSLTRKPTRESGQISLKGKKGHKAGNLSLSNALSFNISEENILKTPSTINENPQIDLEVLNDSLSNYYQNELNKSSGEYHSTTPVPCLSFKANTIKPEKRSCTPMLRLRYKQNEHPQLHLVKKSPWAEKNSKTLLPKTKAPETANKIRYFSRRERKCGSPEHRKIVLHYFN